MGYEGASASEGRDGGRTMRPEPLELAAMTDGFSAVLPSVLGMFPDAVGPLRRERAGKEIV
jgi:hypothetical protein